MSLEAWMVSLPASPNRRTKLYAGTPGVYVEHDRVVTGAAADDHHPRDIAGGRVRPLGDAGLRSHAGRVLHLVEEVGLSWLPRSGWESRSS